MIIAVYFHARFRDLLLCQNDRIVYPTTVLRWEIGRPIERYLEKKKFSSGSRKYCVSGVSLIHAGIATKIFKHRIIHR